MHGRAIITLFTVCMLVGGCDRAAAVPDFATRDSAGVRIVESARQEWKEGDQWTVSSTPLLEIGVTEGELPYELSRVTGATRLSDGGIVIGNGHTNELRFFDAGGAHVRTVGRSGGGPGEYEYMRKLMSCGPDSIAAFDLHWQLKVYDRSGKLSRETRLHQPGSERTPYALSCGPSGHFVITGWGAETRESRIGFYQATSPVYLLDRRGEGMAELGEFVSSERIGSERGSRPHPLGRSTVLALSSDEIFVATGETPEVRTYGFDGAPRRILRAPSRDLRITDEDLDRFRQAQMEPVPDHLRPAAERELLEMPMPERFPATSELLLDADGNLWMRHFTRPGEPKPRWGIFSLEGRYLGELETPEGVRVLEIGTDYLLGLHRDELNVERARVYSLQK